MRWLLVVVFVGALVGKLGQLGVLHHYVHISALAVWHHAVRAILDCTTIGLLDIGKVATALICQGIKWTVAKQAVEVIWIVCLVTWEVFAIAILEK